MHRLSNEELEQLPITAFDGEIVIVDSPEKLDVALQEMQKCPILGFDTETRPSFTRGVSYKVALLQLSTQTKCWLIRLNKLGMLPEIVAILENKNILKVGAAIIDDVKALKKIRPFDANNFVDLQTIARENGLEDFSLKKLAAHVMGVRISKRQRLSNWEAPSLAPPQQLYAATDAWISLMIYHGMMAGVFEHPNLKRILKQ